MMEGLDILEKNNYEKTLLLIDWTFVLWIILLQVYKKDTNRYLQKRYFAGGDGQ